MFRLCFYSVRWTAGVWFPFAFLRVSDGGVGFPFNPQWLCMVSIGLSMVCYVVLSLCEGVH